MRVWPGEERPLGASWDGAGTNFAVFSESAERVELCLFDAAGNETRVDLPEVRGYVWHGYLPEISPGQRYGYRVHGPYEPSRGHRSTPHKLLLDPYGKALSGTLKWDEAVFAYSFAGGPDSTNTSDSAPFLPKSVVTNPYFDWRDDRSPRTPEHATVIYEAHVKGLTKLHPHVPKSIRGTYAALGHPAVIEHLLALGVTAVELMPVQHFVHDHFLVSRGLSNYWGYNTLGFFAPHAEYASSGSLGEQVLEFKAMVRALHEAGLEVILDVVYNHTAEGNHMGPTLSFRGLDNLTYYRLVSNDLRYYMDYTGCGNTLDMRHPQVLQLVTDSLRYWVQEMHVDGFRFDLAATLARGSDAMDKASAFLALLHQDPVLSLVKLIAEPWDLGAGGYQVGGFPPRWAEWNGKYRDAVRDFWRGECRVGEFVMRITGSSDLYASTGRRPFASVNFITAHDGFTLRDLVSYNHKHNEANGENNTDGDNHNRSWNSGVEGETDDPEIVALRRRQVRNFLVTLFLSQGIPMMLAGDELGRTQGGNNNGFCQDNEISWIDWAGADEELLAFTRSLIRFQHDHSAFRRRRWFDGATIGRYLSDVGWFKLNGEAMQKEDWETPYAKTIAMFINGDGLPTPDRYGRPILDDSFFVAFNAHWEDRTFLLPPVLGSGWRRVIDTASSKPFQARRGEDVSGEFTVRGRSVIALCRSRTPIVAGDSEAP